MEINIRQMKTRNRPDYLLNDNMIVNINPIQDGLFGVAHGWEGGGERENKKSPPLKNLSHISYIDENWHSYILFKDDPKNA